MALLDRPGDDASTRSDRIAALLRFVHQRDFERVAQGLELRAGAVEFVNRMRRAGFMVGLLSDRYFVAAEEVRRRIFVDFALAHMLQFDAEVCSGKLRLNAAFVAPQGDAGPAVCKSHVLGRPREDCVQPGVLEYWALGVNVNALGLLRSADRAFAIDPKSPLLAAVPGLTVVKHFDELLAHVPQPMPAAA